MPWNETTGEKQLTISDGGEERDVRVIQVLKNVRGATRFGRFQVVYILARLHPELKSPPRGTGGAFPGPQRGVVELDPVDDPRRRFRSPLLILGLVVTQQIGDIEVQSPAEPLRVRGLRFGDGW
jgi:hypothetical protein